MAMRIVMEQAHSEQSDSDNLHDWAVGQGLVLREVERGGGGGGGGGDVHWFAHVSVMVAFLWMNLCPMLQVFQSLISRCLCLFLA